MQTIIILGAGQFGKAVSDLIDPNQFKLQAFGDNSPFLWNTEIQTAFGKVPVVSIEQAAAFKPDLILIAVSDAARSQMLMDQVKTVFGYRGGLYGFISSHAANAFGFATLMALIMRDKLFGWTIFFWAALTAYTRVYLGVHFISDIVPGAVSGVFFGYLVYRLYSFSRSKLLPVQVNNGEPLYSKKRIRLIVYAIYVTILIIIIFNVPLAACLQK